MPALPPSPNLEQLKNRAKDLLRAYRLGDPQARLRVREYLPHPTSAASTGTDERRFRLSDALLVLAREYGFPSWPKLKAAVEAAAGGAGTSLAPRQALPAMEIEPSPRKRFIRDLSAEIAGLAGGRDAQPLAVRFSAMPLRDIVSVRASLVESGEYPLLVDALIAGLAHASPWVRYNCAGALDHLGDDRCAGPLRRLLNDPVPRVRRMALHSLACDACKLAPLRRGEDIIALMVERALEDPSVKVRRHAAAGLADSSDARAISALETVVARETDPSLLRIARRGLAGRAASVLQ